VYLRVPDWESAADDAALHGSGSNFPKDTISGASKRRGERENDCWERKAAGTFLCMPLPAKRERERESGATHVSFLLIALLL